MFRLPTNRHARIQLSVVVAFLVLTGVAAWLLSNYLDQTSKNAALYEAVIADDIELARSLIVEGADPNGNIGFRFRRDDDFAFYRPLEHAIDQGNIAMMSLLMDSGADLYLTFHHRYGLKTETAERTALGWALYLCNKNAAHYLVYESGKFDLAREDLDLLMLLTAQCGDVVLIERWIELGADPIAASTPARPFGPHSPLHFAVMGDNEDVARILVQHGADVNLESISYPRGTPLNLAISYGSIELIRTLLDLGADPNGVSRDYTPLHAAVDRKDAEAMRLLLDRGADPSIADSDGVLPIERAQELGLRDIAALIQDHKPTPIEPE